MCAMNWLSWGCFEGNPCYYCIANVAQRSQKPHVFVQPRGALRPVQRPGEVRGAGGFGVSWTSLLLVWFYLNVWTPPRRGGRVLRLEEVPQRGTYFANLAYVTAHFKIKSASVVVLEANGRLLAIIGCFLFFQPTFTRSRYATKQTRARPPETCVPWCVSGVNLRTKYRHVWGHTCPSNTHVQYHWGDPGELNPGGSDMWPGRPLLPKFDSWRGG